jgi:hypothetical protein
MRAWLLCAAVAVAVAACGTGPDAEAVVRTWSKAINTGDSGRAADLFAPGAKVVQASLGVLNSHEDAVAWNAALPCTGEIVALVSVSDEVVNATFLLGEGNGHRCDGRGARIAVVFTVRRGHIEAFHQLPPPPAYVQALSA